MTAYYHNLFEEALKKDVIKTVMEMVDGDETTLSILQQEIIKLTPDFTETIIPIKKYICREDFTFSEHNCCARVWNEGYGGQCTKKKKNSSRICGKHQNMIDKYGELWLGYITDDCPRNPVHPNGKVHQWRHHLKD